MKKYSKCFFVAVFVSFLLMTKMFCSDLPEKNYVVKVLTGAQVNEFLPFVAQERIANFCEYPYLYRGNLDYELHYLNPYAQWHDTAIAVAYLENTPVGFLTGTSLAAFDQHFKGTIVGFKEAGFKPDSWYYFAEVIVLVQHRGQCLCDQLFKALENYACQRGYKSGCFVTVVRVDNHPQKPQDYKSPDFIWHRLGYNRSSIVVSFDWPTIQVDGSVVDQYHPLIFWLKNL